MSENLEYPKITTLWKREDRKPHNMMPGVYALPEFEALKAINWYWTEKVDGTNIRVHWDGHSVKFYGKTANAQIPTFLYHRLEEIFGGEVNAQVFEQHFGSDPVTLYGEGFGNRIQKGKTYLPDSVDFVLFDVRIGRWWLERGNVDDIAFKLGIPIVPVVGHGTLEMASDFCTTSHKSLWGEANIEGIVMKPTVELFNRSGERIVSKLKYKDFLKLG